MRKIILYIAGSIDGYIARKNGDVDWLFTDADYGYKRFYKSIDCTLMGNNTYKQILTFGDFPYPDKTNYVFTTNPNPQADKNVRFINHNALDFITNLKSETGKDIWLIGGGKLNTFLLDNGLIDTMILSVHPILLGNGIRIFSGGAVERTFKLEKTKKYDSGLIQLSYSIC